MAVRRKSNWYIYLIAFGITLAMIIMAIVSFRDFLFPETQETGLTVDGELSDDFVPDAGMSLSVMTMISDGENDMPELFIIAAYNAVENRLTFIPVNNGIALVRTGRTLPNIYAAQGGEGVVDAVSNECGINFDGYIRFDRSSLVDLIALYGNVEYDVAKTLLISDGTDVEPINSGRQNFTAEMVYRYIMFAEFDEGESYRYNMICSLLIELINQNVSFVDSSLLDNFAKQIMERAETNLTEEIYLAHKAAMLNTVQYGINPAEYYVPYGEYNGDGSFTISENSVLTIRQKSGQDQ
ncbi:MAG: LCP family protein [Oscillospiraceae bacterium]|nr:LCP family protein [Oscillospiraceae bacterium]